LCSGTDIAVPVAGWAIAYGPVCFRPSAYHGMDIMVQLTYVEAFAGTVGIVDYTNYDDMKYAVSIFFPLDCMFFRSVLLST
jgi:hypothetical protein